MLSANYSVNSLDFKSCISGGSESLVLNHKDIESTSQIFIRAIIDPDPEISKQDVEFIFSDLRVIVSLPTFEKLFRFQKKLRP